MLDVEKMLQADVNSRSIINRIYYSIFYIVLALFIKFDIQIKTSKHTGIISLFDKEFIHTKKIDKQYSEIYHKLFNFRQESDYKDFIKVTKDDVIEKTKNAKKFIIKIKEYIDKNK